MKKNYTVITLLVHYWYFVIMISNIIYRRYSLKYLIECIKQEENIKVIKIWIFNEVPHSYDQFGVVLFNQLYIQYIHIIFLVDMYVVYWYFSLDQEVIGVIIYYYIEFIMMREDMDGCAGGLCFIF